MARAATLPLLAVLAGCTFGGGSNGAREPAAQIFVDQRPIDGAADALAVYLQTLRSLIEGDAVVQADVFRNVAAAADSAPTTTNRLMLALALATPTHSSSDATRRSVCSPTSSRRATRCCPKSTLWRSFI